MIIVIAFRIIVALLPGAWLRRLLTLVFQVRVIDHLGDPYLSRWTLREHENRGHDYLHYFHRGDLDGDLHSHPWDGHGVILAWGYREDRRAFDAVYTTDYRFGNRTRLLTDTFHRVDLLRPEKGCWTYFATTGKTKSWWFWNIVTGEITPWRVRLRQSHHQEPR